MAVSTPRRFKKCAIKVTSPNQDGVEGTDARCGLDADREIRDTTHYASLHQGNVSFFPLKEAHFSPCSLPSTTSLRISWGYGAQDKKGHKRRELDVSTCFGPLLQWILAWWP